MSNCRRPVTRSSVRRPTRICRQNPFVGLPMYGRTNNHYAPSKDMPGTCRYRRPAIKTTAPDHANASVSPPAPPVRPFKYSSSRSCFSYRRGKSAHVARKTTDYVIRILNANKIVRHTETFRFNQTTVGHFCTRGLVQMINTVQVGRRRSYRRVPFEFRRWFYRFQFTRLFRDASFWSTIVNND